VPEVDIARVVAIDPKTLRKHYRQELDVGSVKANTKIAREPVSEGSWRWRAVGDRGDLLAQDTRWMESDRGSENKHDGPLVVFRTIVQPPPRDPITGRVLALEAPQAS
jgi:hypothetical protein